MRVLVLLAVLSCVAWSASAQCDFTADTIGQEQIALLQAVSTHCISGQSECGEGTPCQEALDAYFSWFERCLDVIAGAGEEVVEAYREAVDTIVESVCGILNEIDDLITDVLVCVAKEGLTDDLQAAALAITTECANDRADIQCSEQCGAALEHYYRLFFECYPHADHTDVALDSLRGQLETVCEVISDADACQQSSVAASLDVRQHCHPQTDEDIGNCSGDCFEAIAHLDSVAGTTCGDFGEDLLGSWRQTCSECGTAAYAAVRQMQEACREVDWPTITECPAECSAAVDAAKEAAECYPGPSVIRRTTRAVWRLKERACSVPASSGAICLLQEAQDQWVPLVETCQQDGICDWNCQEHIRDVRGLADDCFDGNPLDENVRESLDEVWEQCPDGETVIHILIDNMTAEEIRENVRDFLVRIAIAFRVTLGNLWLAYVDELDDGKREHRTDCSIVVRNETPNGDDDSLSDVGIEGDSETRANEEGGSGGNVAATLFAPVALIFSVLFSLYFF